MHRIGGLRLRLPQHFPETSPDPPNRTLQMYRIRSARPPGRNSSSPAPGGFEGNQPAPMRACSDYGATPCFAIRLASPEPMKGPPLRRLSVSSIEGLPGGRAGVDVVETRSFAESSTGVPDSRRDSSRLAPSNGEIKSSRPGTRSAYPRQSYQQGSKQRRGAADENNRATADRRPVCLSRSRRDLSRNAGSNHAGAPHPFRVRTSDRQSRQRPPGRAASLRE